MAHFVVICKKLEEDRDYSLLDKEIVDPEVRLRVLIYRNKETVRVSKLIRNLWIHRRDLLRKQAKALRTIGTEEGVTVINGLEYCEDRINGVSIRKDQVSVPVIHMVDEISVPVDEVSIPGPPRDRVSDVEAGQTPIPEHP